MAETDGVVEHDLSSNRLSQPGVVFPRLFVGLVVLICAEVFSGASIRVGLWHPWTWLVTFGLYFAHFFFFTTLAVGTGRVSLSALYLWGVLFGLYESWITKVIWYGYGADGKLGMGSIGPYGYSEISMVFFFHPVASFLLPLTVACVLFPTLRALFPDLAWFTGKAKGARAVRAYLLFTFATVMALNSGGPANLILNLAIMLVPLLVLSRLARPAAKLSDGRSILIFGRRGFVGLCLYLILLYATSYFLLNPEGLPSAPVQLFTFVFYALVIAGLCSHRRRETRPDNMVEVVQGELRLIKVLFAVLLGLAVVLSTLVGKPVLLFPLGLNFVIWTPLGFLLTAAALVAGIRQRISPGKGAPQE